MFKEKFPPIFVDAMRNLTETGTGNIELNGRTGKIFNIVCGSGQGNPPSAGNFNLGSDPVLRVIQKVIENCTFRLRNGIRVPPTAYADDHLHLTRAQNAMQIMDIFRVYSDFEKVSGLKIALNKTVIMGINTPPQLLQEIAEITGIQIVESFRYLGVEIRQTYLESKEASFQKTYDTLERKFDRINSTYLDLMHKRQLINMAILPAFNHIFMAFGFDERWGGIIDKKVLNLLWTQKSGGERRQKRRLIAKKRINASFEMGGLKMNFTKQIADGLLLNTLKRVKVQLTGPEDKQLLISKIFERIVLDKMAISIIDMFKIAGPVTWQTLAARTGRVSMISQSFEAMASFIGSTETDKRTWSAAPILGHSRTNPIYRISVAEGLELYRGGLTFVAQLFGMDELTGKIDRNSNASLHQIANRNLVQKCKALRSRLALLVSRDDLHPGTGTLVALDRLRWSNAYRKLE